MKLILLMILTISLNAQTKIIQIQPFGDISQEYVDVVYTQLSKVYPKVIVNKRILLPKFALVNGRYRSDSLLKHLRNLTTKSTCIVGITNKDITCPNKGYSDWGIFGYGDLPGNVSVASSYRLNKSNKGVQLYKTVVHELGHNFGLNHCPSIGCLMSDAKGKNNIDNENHFCIKCKKHLTAQNWVLTNQTTN